jgi:hypothetical protein
MRILTLALLFALTVALTVEGQKLSPDLESRVVRGRLNVIIQYDHAPGVAEHRMVEQHGGVFYRDLSGVRSGAYSVSSSELASIAADPAVLHI